VTVNAVCACEVRSISIGLQVGADPSSPTPTCRRAIPYAVSDHELDLNELSGHDYSAWFPLFMPGDLSDHGSIRPRIDMVVSDRPYCEIITKNDAYGVIFDAFGAADLLPRLVFRIRQKNLWARVGSGSLASE
jgi:hypothetical protein